MGRCTNLEKSASFPIRVGSSMVIALLLVASTCARADDRYFLLIFGTQSEPKKLKDFHTWATFVRVSDQGQADPLKIEMHTISWLPKTLEVKPANLIPEQGVNLTLEQTLHLAEKSCRGVKMWGPFVTTCDVYQRCLKVEQSLDCGKIKYRYASSGLNPKVNCCRHAVVRGVDPWFVAERYPSVRGGYAGSEAIAKKFARKSRRQGVDQSHVDNSWLIPLLGLDQHKIAIIPPSDILR